MKKRGTVDQLPSGRWRVRISLGGAQKTLGTYDNEITAREELAMAVEADESTSREFVGLTVGQLGERIVSRREVKREVRDWKSDRSRWDKHIKSDEIATLAVTKLAPKNIYAWIGRLKAKGLAAQTVRNCRNLLSVILKEACEQGTIRTNPCADVRIGKGAKVSAEAGWTYLVPEEQQRLIAACASTEERCIVAFAIGTGLRAGELCALRRVDVDLDGRRIMVRFGAPPAEPTKTGRVRQVPLFGVALEAAKTWLAFAVTLPSAGPLFPRIARERSRASRYGAARDPNHVLTWKAWKGALERAAIGRRVRWHDLRHTCASSLVSGWWGRRWSLQEVKEMLGHTSIDVTQRYAHLSPSALEEAGKGTSGGGFGPEVTPKSLPQKTEQNGGSFEFLNRRSQVRLLSGAPAGTPEEKADSSSEELPKDLGSVTSVTGDVSDALQAARKGLAAVYGGTVPS